MLKKCLSLLLALFAVCCCFSAAAQSETGTIAVKLNSDIAGLTKEDAEKLIELKTKNVVFAARGDGPILIADYAGSTEVGALEPGRTYYIYYTLEAAPGFALPAQLADGDVAIECAKGVSVLASQIVSLENAHGDEAAAPYRALQISAKVVTDGNVFERLLGWFRDLILKIRAWSLY